MELKQNISKLSAFTEYVPRTVMQVEGTFIEGLHNQPSLRYSNFSN